MRVLIVGGGKVGQGLAELLLGSQRPVTIVEARAERADELRRDLPRVVVVVGSGTDPAVLETVGIRQVAVVAAVTGADETNLVVSNLARLAFHVPRVIARVNNPKNAWLFTPAMGVDVALNQADLMAHLIAEEMSLGEMMTLLKLRRGQYALVEEKIAPQSAAVGLPVRSLRLPADCALIAILRGGRLILPRNDTVLAAEDEVLALTPSAALGRLAEALG